LKNLKSINFLFLLGSSSSLFIGFEPEKFRRIIRGFLIAVALTTAE
jgi:hypothetical protein